MKFPALLKKLICLLFPKRCAYCGEFIKDGILCRRCAEEYMIEASSGCLSCGESFPFCSCKTKHLGGESFIYCLPYKSENSVARELILKCKSIKLPSVINDLTDKMSAAMALRDIDRSYIITYVPRSPASKRRTGVDQARELALALSKKTGHRCYRLISCRETHREQKSLSLSERKEHAEKRYRMISTRSKTALGKNIILVDDVVTSGATAKRCIELLKEAGADDVICLSAARSVKYI